LSRGAGFPARPDSDHPQTKVRGSPGGLPRTVPASLAHRLRGAGFCYLAAWAFFSLGSSALVVFTTSSANFRWLARICSMKS
jgi:hypothetical protein